MKKLLLLFIMILSTVSYSQTAITDANIQTASRHFGFQHKPAAATERVAIVSMVQCLIGM